MWVSNRNYVTRVLIAWMLPEFLPCYFSIWVLTKHPFCKLWSKFLILWKIECLIRMRCCGHRGLKPCPAACHHGSAMLHSLKLWLLMRQLLTLEKCLSFEDKIRNIPVTNHVSWLCIFSFFFLSFCFQKEHTDCQCLFLFVLFFFPIVF